MPKNKKSKDEQALENLAKRLLNTPPEPRDRVTDKAHAERDEGKLERKRTGKSKPAK